MGGGKKCPECLSNIEQDADVCRFCGYRVTGVKCGKCASMCRPEAKVCRWCGEPFVTKATSKLDKDVEIKASFLGTLYLTRSFYPQYITFKKDSVIIVTFGFLMMSKKEQKLDWDAIAGASLKGGIIWDIVTINMKDGSSAVLNAIRHSDSAFIMDLFKK
jgi:hypothetical protein